MSSWDPHHQQLLLLLGLCPASGLKPSSRLSPASGLSSGLFCCRRRAQAAAPLLIASRVGLDLITAAVFSTSLWTSRVAKPAHRDEHELVVSTSRLSLRALSEVSWMLSEPSLPSRLVLGALPRPPISNSPRSGPHLRGRPPQRRASANWKAGRRLSREENNSRSLCQTQA